MKRDIITREASRMKETKYRETTAPPTCSTWFGFGLGSGLGLGVVVGLGLGLGLGLRSGLGSGYCRGQGRMATCSTEPMAAVCYRVRTRGVVRAGLRLTELMAVLLHISTYCLLLTAYCLLLTTYYLPRRWRCCYTYRGSRAIRTSWSSHSWCSRTC
jgi:hypothetical protein